MLRNGTIQMNKNELIEMILFSFKSRNFKTDDIVKQAVNLILDQISETASKKDGRVEIRDFGAFFLKTYSRKRFCRNPKTGDKWRAVTRNSFRFRASKSLKKSIAACNADDVASRYAAARTAFKQRRLKK